MTRGRYLLALLALCPLLQATPDPIIITLNPNKASHVLDEHFVSLTINPTDLLQGKPFGMGSNGTLEMLKALSPAYVRLGGPDTSHYVFLHGNQNHPEMRSSGDIIITESHWKEVNDMLQRAGMDVIACLNNGLKDGEKWDPRNSLEAIAYSEKQVFNITWQLGYEPVRTDELSGAKLGKQMSNLRTLLNGFPLYKNSKLIGPDVRSVHRKEDQEHLLELLIEAGPVLDAVTWHPRWPHVSSVRLSDTSEEGYEFPPDYLEWDRNQLAKLLQRTLLKKPLWISEPRGDNSGSFAEGLIWARRLAIAARLGIEVVMKQPSLNDISHPKPEYWVALMHKKFLGRTLLETRSLSNHSELSMVVQCTSKQYGQDVDGGITIFAVNMEGSPQRALVRGIPPSKQGEELTYQYILTAGQDIFSQMTYLNGEPLLMDETGRLPTFSPKIRKVGQSLSIKLPPYSIGFWVIPQAKVRICQQEPQTLAPVPLDDLSVKVLQNTQKGVNALRNMNQLLVDELLHPTVGEGRGSDSKEANEEGTAKKRENRETVFAGIEEELKKRVGEIKELMNFNLKGLESKLGFRSVQNNELRATESKINDLARDLRTIMNAADQQKEFNRFLEISGLNEDYGRKMMDERLAKGKQDQKLDDEFELEGDDNKMKRHRREIDDNNGKNTIKKFHNNEGKNTIMNVDDNYKQVLSNQIRALKVHPNSLPNLELQKISNELQEELLLKEISILETTEEQMMAALTAHKKQHELMDKMIKDEVSHMKESKIAALVEMKMGGLTKNSETSKQETNILANNEDREGVAKKRDIGKQGISENELNDKEQKVDPLAAIKTLINKKREKLQPPSKNILQSKLEELRNKYNLQVNLRKTDTTTPEPTTTSEQIIPQGNEETLKNNEKRRADVLQYMSKVISQLETEEGQKTTKETNVESSRKARKTNETPTNNEHDTITESKNQDETTEKVGKTDNDDKLKRASELFEKIREATKGMEEGGKESTPSDDESSEDSSSDMNESLQDNEIISQEIENFKEQNRVAIPDETKKFRSGGNNGRIINSRDSGKREKQGEEKSTLRTASDSTKTHVGDDEQFRKNKPTSGVEQPSKSEQLGKTDQFRENGQFSEAKQPSKSEQPGKTDQYWKYEPSRNTEQLRPSVPSRNTEQFGQGEPLSRNTKPHGQDEPSRTTKPLGQDEPSRNTKPLEQDEYYEYSENESQREGTTSPKPNHSRTERKKRDAYDVERAVQRDPEGGAEDVRQSEDVLRNTILKKGSRSESSTLKPGQYLEWAEKTVKQVLDKVIPAAYEQTKKQLEDIDLPEYLGNWNGIVDHLNTLNSVLKVATGEIAAATPISEHVQRIERTKRSTDDGDIGYLSEDTIDYPANEKNKIEDDVNRIKSHDANLAQDNVKEELTTTSNTEKETPEESSKVEVKNNSEATERKQRGGDVTTNSPSTENLINKENRTLGDIKSMESPQTEPPSSTEQAVMNANLLPRQTEQMSRDIITHVLLNEVVDELVNDIMKKGEKEVEREILEMEKEAQKKKGKNPEEVKMGENINSLHVNKIAQKHPNNHIMEDDDDPSTPWLASAHSIIDQLMMNIMQHQQQEEQQNQKIATKNKGKREVPVHVPLKKGALEATQIQPNDQINQYLRHLQPGVYVVPSEDMLNVHADQSVKSLAAPQAGKTTPNVVTLNIYYDKREAEEKPEKTPLTPYRPMAHTGTSVGGPTHLRQTAWPSLPTYKNSLPPLPNLPSVPRHYAPRPAPAITAPALTTPIPRTPLLHRLTPKKTLYDSRYQIPSLPIASQLPTYEPTAYPTLGQSIPQYDDGYSVVGQDNEYVYAQPAQQKPPQQKMIPVSPPTTWSKQKTKDLTADYNWEEEEEAPEKESDDLQMLDIPDSKTEDESDAWYLRKAINEPTLHVKKEMPKPISKSRNHHITLDRKSLIEPYWNRTLKEIFQQTSNDPYWGILREDKPNEKHSEEAESYIEYHSEEDDENQNKEQQGRNKRSFPESMTKEWHWINSAPADYFVNDFNFPRSKRDHKKLLNNLVLRERSARGPLIDSDRVVHDILPKRDYKRVSDPDSSLEDGQNYDNVQPGISVFGKKLGLGSYSTGKLGKVNRSERANNVATFLIEVSSPEELLSRNEIRDSALIIPDFDSFGKRLETSWDINKDDAKSIVPEDVRHPKDTIVDPILNAYKTALGIINNVSAFV